MLSGKVKRLKVPSPTPAPPAFADGRFSKPKVGILSVLPAFNFNVPSLHIYHIIQGEDKGTHAAR